MRLVHFIVIFCLMVFFAGCAPGPRLGSSAKRVSLEDLCGKYAIDCAWDGVVQTVTMHYRGQKIRALLGSNIVIVGGVTVTLSAPLERSQGMVFVPEDFERLVLLSEKVFVPGVPAAGHLAVRIVIDAGHGGKDAGATGLYDIREKDIDLDLARRVAANFRNAGVDVILTRDKDEFISLDGRTEVTTRPDVDFFLSIHANANRDHHARGLEVYYSGLLGKDDSHDPRRYSNEKKICALFNMRRDSDILNRTVLGMLYANKMEMSSVMADAVARGMAANLGQK
ncbi:MAG: N-acetylmuramoyl-L-alanine amidase, partial [Candidatus Omnitrophota bacterium]